MFDIDSGKLLIIGIVALVVIGPKELPGVMRQVGQAIGKLRRMAAEFQGQFMDAMREAELEELKKDVDKMSKAVDFDGLDPFGDVKTKVDEVRADVESALNAPVAPVETAELPVHPQTPEAGEATVAGAGIAPVADVAPVAPEPLPPPIPERLAEAASASEPQIAKTGGTA